jgi:hypothetical protein
MNTKTKRKIAVIASLRLFTSGRSKNLLQFVSLLLQQCSLVLDIEDSLVEVFDLFVEPGYLVQNRVELQAGAPEVLERIADVEATVTSDGDALNATGIRRVMLGVVDRVVDLLYLFRGMTI